MKKKIVITITMIILIFQTINPLKVYATPLETADLVAGRLLQPTVTFFTFVIDSLMSVVSWCMNQNDLELVMVDSVTDIQDYGETEVVPYTINDPESFKSIWGNLNVKYPNFTYTPEEIFSGELALLDINFLDNSNTDTNWGKIQGAISAWYKVLRGIAIIGLLSILIYTGIKIIISSNTKDKAKYKELIVNWFIAVILAFSMHYIMAFILNVVEEAMGLLQGIGGVIEVSIDGTKFKTNLMGLARFQLQHKNLTEKVGYLVIYAALVTYTIKFTIVYLKRVLNMAFFTLISPIVALTYPLDKMNGKAKGFEMWLKDFLYNALLQPMHYILYYILISTSLSLAANNLLYGIVALMFVSEAETLLKKIFGFGKANGGTVKGLAGALATGAAVTTFTNLVKNPLHPASGLGLSSSGSGNTKSESDQIYEEPNDIMEDTTFEAILQNGFGGTTGNAEKNGTQRKLPVADSKISKYRENLSRYKTEELGNVTFKDGDNRSIEDIIKILAKKQGKGKGYSTDELDRLRSLVQNRIETNESSFTANGIPLQYTDGDSRSTTELMNEAIKYKNLANNMSLSENKRRQHARKAQELMDKINRRMTENQYIQTQGGPGALLGKTNEEDNKVKVPRFIKGSAHLAKTIVKPVWDIEKSGKENAKKLTGKILKEVTGAGIGMAAVAVQAGISLTDGKYNALEAAGTFAAGLVGANQLGKVAGDIGKTYKEGAMAGEEASQTIKQYGERWFNRDDVIKEYKREFAGQGKEMRRRAVENYVSRGITDSKEQIKAIKYAEVLKKERGISEDEADKIAAATLQYKQSLTTHGNYAILYDSEKREEYIKAKVDAYTGSASKDSVERLHNEFIENVRDLEKANC